MFEIEGIDSISTDNSLITRAGDSTIDDNTFVTGLNDSQRAMLYSGFKGTAFNDSALIDGEGKAITDFKSLRATLLSQVNLYNTVSTLDISGYDSIDLDGVKLTINDKGEGVDPEGKIVKTPIEVRSLIYQNDPEFNKGDGTDDLTLPVIMTKIGELSGFIPTDDQGNAIEFEASVEGLAKREAFLVKQFGSQQANMVLEQLFATHPEIEEMLDYKTLHNSLKGYMPSEDLNAITLEKTNVDMHKDIMIKANLARGLSPERAAMYAQYAIDEKTSFNTATEDLEFLKANKSAKLEARRTEEEAANRTRRENQANYIKTVESVIKAGKVGDITIPEFIKAKRSDGSILQIPREQLFKYMFEPVKDGMSAYTVAKSQEDDTMKLNEHILDAYMRLTGNDRSSIIKAESATSRVNLIKKAAAGAAGSGGRALQVTTGAKTLDMNTIIL